MGAARRATELDSETAAIDLGACRSNGQVSLSMASLHRARREGLEASPLLSGGSRFGPI